MVQTISRVNNNLWRRNQGGLYAPDRRRFPLNGLVLFIPLWHPELTGSPFLSKDLNAFSCAVTGATWGTTGRTFDGINDYIATGAFTALDFGASDWTALVWAKITGTGVVDGEQTLFAKTGATWATPGKQLKWVEATTKFAFGAWGIGDYAFNTAFPINIWHLVGVTFNDTTNLTSFFVDAVADGSATVALTADNATHTLRIGFSGDILPMKGIIGEVFLYNRALTVTEIQHILLATKWRYR